MKQRSFKRGMKVKMYTHSDDGNTGIFQGRMETVPGEVIKVDEDKPDHFIIKFNHPDGTTWEDVFRYFFEMRQGGYAQGLINLDQVFFPMEFVQKLSNDAPEEYIVIRATDCIQL